MSKLTAQALDTYSGWRARGVPILITSHEAFILTDGKVGTEGDAHTAMRLSAVALKFSKTTKETS